MKHMLDYLVDHPEKGLLGYELGLKTIVQYWRSFDQLEAFAKDKDDPHLEVWRDYWKRVGKSTRTGIWHETFLVRAGEYEAVYGNMPTSRAGQGQPPRLGERGSLGPRAAQGRVHHGLNPAVGAMLDRHGQDRRQGVHRDRRGRRPRQGRRRGPGP